MTPAFDAATAEETIAAYVSGGAPAEALLTLLPEQHPLYAGRSTNEVARIRGWILAAFETAGLPEGALPYVLEELQSGRNAYLAAAAARALRGHAADGRFIPFLRDALTNVRAIDAPVTFASYKPRWPVERPTTASAEIRSTLEWIGETGDCCAIPFAPDRSRRSASLDVELEDQEGRRLAFGDFFRGKWSVVAFFYTRCDNPEKCSLTVTQLARLQTAVESSALRDNVRIAAITYDPAYDLPSRLRRFGENRGIRFAHDVRFFRAPSGLDDLRARFDLGVNFTGSVVNRHRIELYVLDEQANIVATFSRMQWDVPAVMSELEALATQPRRVWKAALAAAPPILLALLPKCPLCLGAWLAAAGLGGLQFLANRAWSIPMAMALLLLHVTLVYRRSRKTHNRLAIALSIAGALAIVAGVAFPGAQPASIAGAILIGLASLAIPWPSHRLPDSGAAVRHEQYEPQGERYSPRSSG